MPGKTISSLETQRRTEEFIKSYQCSIDISIDKE